MASAKKSISAKHRSPHRAKKARSGGRWGDEFRVRLRLLIRERYKGNQAKFAAACGFDPPRVSGWLAGKSLVSLGILNAIAQDTGVSVDWLLTGNGHDGHPEPNIVYRGQFRKQPDLESDIRASIGRDVGEIGGLTFDRFDVDVDKVLGDMVGYVRAEMIRYNEWYRVDFQRAYHALHLAQSALFQLPIAEANTLRTAASRADIGPLPAVIAGLCPEPPSLKYVTVNQSTFGMEPPGETWARWRSAHASTTIEHARRDGVNLIKLNGDEVYRENAEAIGDSGDVSTILAVTPSAVSISIRREE